MAAGLLADLDGSAFWPASVLDKLGAASNLDKRFPDHDGFVLFSGLSVGFDIFDLSSVPDRETDRGGGARRPGAFDRLTCQKRAAGADLPPACQNTDEI